MADIMKIGQIGNFVPMEHVLAGWFHPVAVPEQNDTTDTKGILTLNTSVCYSGKICDLSFFLVAM